MLSKLKKLAFSFFVAGCLSVGAETPLAFTVQGKSLDPLAGKPGIPEGWVDVTEKEEWSFKPAQDALDKGYLLFSRHYMLDSTPNSLPGEHEICRELKAFASPDEYEPMSFLLRTLRNIKGLKFSLSELKEESGAVIADKNLELRYALPIPFKSATHNQGYQLRNEILLAEIPEELESEQTFLFWLTVYVPKGSQAGIYKGFVNISANGLETRLPVSLRVFPVDLQANPQQERGMYLGGHQPQYELRRKFYLDMREHGMNTVAPCNFSIDFAWKNGDIEVTFPRLDREVQLYKEAGFSRPLALDMRPVQAWLVSLQAEMAKFAAQGLPFPENHSAPLRSFDVSPTYSDFEEQAYRKIVRSIEAHAAKENYPSLYYLPQEEATNKGVRIQQLQRYSKILKEEGVKVTAWSNGTWGGGDDLQEIDEYMDVRYYNFVSPAIYERTKKSGDFFGIYNHGTRLMYGFFGQKVKAEGMLQWAYIFAATRGMLSNGSGSYGSGMVYLGKEGPLPSPKWERVREGNDDSRYIYTLQELIKKSQNAGEQGKSAAAKAQTELDGILAAIPFVTTEMNEFERRTNPAQYDIWRFRLIRQILNLQNIASQASSSEGSGIGSETLVAGNRALPSAAAGSAEAVKIATPSLIVPFISSKPDLAALLEDSWPAQPAEIAKLSLIGDQARARMRALAADEGSQDLSRAEPNQATSVKLAYTKEALYLSFLCHEEQMDRLVSNCKQRDGAVYADDAIELFVKPNPNAPDYYQIASNSLAVLADLHWHQVDVVKRQKQGDWDPPIGVVSKRLQKGWRVALEIPFKVFGLETAPNDGAFWYMNIGREQQPTPGVELSSWAPVQTSFHEVIRWGKMFFSQIPPVVIESLELGTPCFGDNELTMQIVNNSGKPQSGFVMLSSSNNVEAATLSKWVCNTQSCKLGIPYKVKSTGALSMSFDLLDENRKVLYTSTYEGLVPEIMAAKLDQSEFSSDHVPVLIQLNLGERELAQYNIEFVLKAADRQIRQSDKLRFAGPQEFVLDMKNRAPGVYALEVNLREGKGRVLHSQELHFSLLESIYQ